MFCLVVDEMRQILASLHRDEQIHGLAEETQPSQRFDFDETRKHNMSEIAANNASEILVQRESWQNLNNNKRDIKLKTKKPKM